MRLLRSLFFLLVLIAVPCVAQPEYEPLPIDKDVRMGVLDNGLTYFIRYNNWPENRANFYIAQRVGSLEEDDNQRGLAHFLEHMCFNGTENFPGNSVGDYCRSIGVEFGKDLNAYTSIEETVYNISNVPTDRVEALDSCLLILRDWADGLLLEPEEIDKERGVIHEEWRMRTSANNRMIERNLPVMYPGSKYGERYPIGLMEIIDNFQPEELRAYYEKWYHPANQGIIVIGNVDVDHVEAVIHELFDPMTNPEPMAEIVHEAVPDNKEAIIIIDKDVEYKTTDVDIFMKCEPFPTELKNTTIYLINDFLLGAAMGMLNDRYDEMALDPDCPYVSASVYYGNFFIAKSMDAFHFGITPKAPTLLAPAMTAALVEARRAATYGFTQTEYDRYKSDFLSELDKRYSNKDKTPNDYYFRAIRAHFLDHEPMLSLDDSYEFYHQLVPLLPLELVNEVMSQLVLPTDENVVIANFNNEAEGAYYPTEDELLDALHAGQQADVEPYIDNVKDEPLISELPTPGEIIAESHSDKFDYTELTLSNGVTVVLKQTDYKNDEVLLSGKGGAGETAYPADDVNLKLFDDVISVSGLGAFSSTELQKALAGKIANADLTMDTRTMAVSGVATPKDVETMLQMVYLYFTAINKDQASYDNLISRLEVELKNRRLSPETAFVDSVQLTLNGHHVREYPLTAEELPRISYDAILAMAANATRSANGWEFTIIGNYDAETIRPLVCQYLGALPSDEKIPASAREVFPVTGKVDNIFTRQQETPKAFASVVIHNSDMAYSYEKAKRLEMLGEVLMMVYLEKIREDAGAAYTVSAGGGGSIADDGYCRYSLQIVCPMQPEKADIAMDIIFSELEAAKTTIDADKLQKVKEAKVKNYDDNQKKNAYWAQVIDMWREHGIDVQSVGREVVERQTPELLQETLIEFLAPGNIVTVEMLPE